MNLKSHTEEQIIAILKEQEAGMKTADVCRKHGISEATLQLEAKHAGSRSPTRSGCGRTVEDGSQAVR